MPLSRPWEMGTVIRASRGCIEKVRRVVGTCDGPGATLRLMAARGTNESGLDEPGRNGNSPEYQRLLGHFGVNPVDWECC